MQISQKADQVAWYSHLFKNFPQFVVIYTVKGELDYKESWMSKNWCFWTVVLEKTLESPLDWKEIQPIHPKVNQSWIFIGRTDIEAECPILWPRDAKNWLIEKDPDAGKDWRWEEKETTEDEMADGITDSMDMNLSRLWEMVMDREACCSPWDWKKFGTTEQLNWTELIDKVGKNWIFEQVFFFNQLY